MVDKLTKKDRENAKKKKKATTTNIPMKIACVRLRSPCLIQRVTWLLYLALSCITFTVGQFITFSVKMYYFYGWVNYYI